MLDRKKQAINEIYWPHSIEAEKDVLGNLIPGKLEEETLAIVIDSIKPEDFYVKDYLVGAS